jgi:hypothetical protein
MFSGIAFPILLFVGASLIVAPSPDTSKGTGPQVAKEWLTTLGKSSDRLQIVIGAFVLVVAALALIWLAAAVRVRFAIAPDGPLFGFALMAAFGIAAGAIGPLAVAGGHDFGNEPLPADGTVIWFLNDLALPALLVIFGLASSAFITSFLLGTRGRNTVPAWLAGFGWLAVVAGLVGVLFIPMIIVLLWYLALGIFGVMRQPTTAASTAAAP